MQLLYHFRISKQAFVELSSIFITSGDTLASMENKLKITHFTDANCFWCYAMEPEMRKIRMLLDNMLEYRIVMGVLSSDIHDFIGQNAEDELRYELHRIEIIDHLKKAGERIGMPFAFDNLMTRNPEEYISLPLSLAYCAMSMIDEHIAEKYLRRMRECLYAEGRSLFGTDALVELASEFPVDLEKFRRNYESGAADFVLRQNIDECHEYNVNVFPTLLMEYGNKRFAVRGYYDYEGLKKIIAQVTDGDIILNEPEYSLEALEAYMNRYGKAAAREIQTMFSLNETQLADAMMDLFSTGRYKTESCESSYFVLPK